MPNTLPRLAATAALAASLAGPLGAQSALPPGAAPDPDASPLRSYAYQVNPGQTHFDVADRAAIANLIYAYAFAYDNQDADAWFGLFTPDAVFVAGEQGQTPVSFSGDGFHTFWRARMKDFAASGEVRRHLMSNILFLDQTADTAHVSVVGLLTSTRDGKSFSAVSSLNYEGWLAKGADGWKIRHWTDFPDAALGP